MPITRIIRRAGELPPLTEEQRADLERLAAMSDEDRLFGLSEADRGAAR